MTSEPEPQHPAESIQECPRRAAIRRIQEEIRKLVPEGVSLSEELIADRRAEA